MSRSFLLLQGVISPFFARLADALAARQHSIQHINFCSGDALYWRGRRAVPYRGDVDAFGPFLESMLTEHSITDIVLFGDERPLHRIAIQQAQGMGLRVHVFEEGYIRPDWVTLEQGGVNANSRLPRDPAWYLEVSRHLDQERKAKAVAGKLRTRAAHDMIYHLANLANPITFPGYRTHRPYNAAVEYAGWAKRFALLPWRARRDQALIEDLVTSKARYYLLPLQLNADAQIVRHSPFANMSALLEQVLHSYALHAPHDTQLVIKNHPLDTGLVDYRRVITRLQERYALQGRVNYLETGHLPTLLRHTLGVITVNSTVGISALANECPTVALGHAIYALPGLTHQGALDDFWQALPNPDSHLYSAFRDTLIHTTQINGGLYTDPDITLAVDNSLASLTGPSPLDSLLDGQVKAATTAQGQQTASIR